MGLANWQDNFWTCHFFYWGNLILLKLLKILNIETNAIFWMSNPQSYVKKQTLYSSLYATQKGAHFQVSLNIYKM